MMKFSLNGPILLFPLSIYCSGSQLLSGSDPILTRSPWLDSEFFNLPNFILQFYDICVCQPILIPRQII